MEDETGQGGWTGRGTRTRRQRTAGYEGQRPATGIDGVGSDAGSGCGIQGKFPRGMKYQIAVEIPTSENGGNRSAGYGGQRPGTGVAGVE